MRICRVQTIALLLLTCGSVACMTDVSSEENVPEVSETAGELLKISSASLWTMRDIHVCFHSETVARSDYAQFSQDARTWIEETYGRILNLRFVGWDPCPSTLTNSISIRIYTPAPGHGSGAQTIAEGSGANANRRISIGESYWAGRREALVHEFAHALDFEHEWDRANSDGVCEPGGSHSTAETFGTPYDPGSITNSTYCGAWTNLSAWDVVGMRRAYGRKPRGAIVGPRNKCLDVDNPTSGNPPATPTQVWDCLGNQNQTWTIEHDWHRLTTTWARGALDVQWGNSSDGTPTWNWDRNTSPAQQWTFSAVEVRGMGDLCLDVPNGNFVAGQTVQLWDCVGNNNQQWNVQLLADGRISLQATNAPGLCVAVNSGVSLQSCGSTGTSLSYGDGQMWNGRTRCADVSAANPVNGTQIVSYNCRATGDYYRQAQEWTFRGPIRGLAGKCLDVDSSGGVRASSKTRIMTCNGSEQQTWEYYF
jgi:hypothetical protein